MKKILLTITCTSTLALSFASQAISVVGDNDDQQGYVAYNCYSYTHNVSLFGGHAPSYHLPVLRAQCAAVNGTFII